MTIELNRNQVLFISIGIMFLSIFLFRINYLLFGKTTIGKVVSVKTWSGRRTTYKAPIIKFETDSYIITFQGETNMDIYTGDMIPVIYQPANPENALAYNFVGFWLSPFLWHLFPFIVLFIPAILSFLNKNDYLIIILQKRPKFYRIKLPLISKEGKKSTNRYR